MEIVLGQIEVGLHVPAHIHHQFFLEEHSVHDVLVIADNPFTMLPEILLTTVFHIIFTPVVQVKYQYTTIKIAIYLIIL